MVCFISKTNRIIYIVSIRSKGGHDIWKQSKVHKSTVQGIVHVLFLSYSYPHSVDFKKRTRTEESISFLFNNLFL